MQPINFNGYLKVDDCYINTKKISTIQLERSKTNIPVKAYINLDDNESVEVKTGNLATLPNKAVKADTCGGIVDYNI